MGIWKVVSKWFYSKNKLLDIAFLNNRNQSSQESQQASIINQQAQGLLPGHATRSTATTRSPFTNLSTASLAVLPLSSGTLSLPLSQCESTQPNPCPEHEIAQRLFLLSYRYLPISAMNLLLQPSIAYNWVLLHFSRVQQTFPGWGQEMFWMKRMEKKSYSDYRRRVGPLMVSKACQKKKHLYYCPGYFWLQSWLGGSQSTLASLKVFSRQLESRYLVVCWKVSLRKTPTSGTVKRAVGCCSFSRRQLDHMKVANPPADAPDSMTLVELYSPYRWFSSSKSDLVILPPRKQRLASLQRSGSLAQPWCRAPSQQGTIILVHSAYLFFRGLGERYPPPLCVSGHSSELPMIVFDRWQAVSRVEGRSSAPKKPPPQNQMRKLLLAMP